MNANDIQDHIKIISNNWMTVNEVEHIDLIPHDQKIQ